MAEAPENLRAADADREAAAARLKAALDEGRLTLLEYDERLREAYAAKTYGDLNALFHDLPRTIPAQRAQVVPARPVAGPAERHAPTPPTDLRKWLLAVWGVWLGAVAINVMIWFLVAISADGPVYFWPMWVAGPWGVFLLVSTILGLANGEPRRHLEHERARRERRARRAARRA